MRMISSLVLVCLLFPLRLHTQPTRGWLTVDTIMRDPAWMGT